MALRSSTRRARQRRQLAVSLTVLAALWIVPAPLLASGVVEKAGDRHLVRDFRPRTAAGLVNVVVEIPAGTNAKWEVVKETGKLEWEQKNGRPRVVEYLAYPGNYGMVPRTILPKELGGDGDPLDVIVLGPALERGSVVAVKLIGVLELHDRGEQDDKLIAVLPGSPLGDVSSLADLDARYRGVRKIVQLWFSNYKGRGKMKARGFGDLARASRILDMAIAAYAERNP